MSEGMSMAAALPVTAMACAGVLVGLAYFAALRRTSILVAAGAAWRGPAALTVSRIGGAAVFLALAARLGAAALLAAFFGFLVARALALRAARRSR